MINHRRSTNLLFPILLLLSFTGAKAQMFTTTSGWSNASPIQAGASVTLGASITQGYLIQYDDTPSYVVTGTITFLDGTTSLGTVPVSQVPVYNWLFPSQQIAPDDADMWDFFDDPGSSSVLETEWATAPDGSSTATTVTAYGPGNLYISQLEGGISMPSWLTGSIWLQSNQPEACSNTQLNLASDVVSDSSTTSPAVRSAWQRFYIKANLQDPSGDQNVTFTITVPGGCTLSVWGAQMEVGNTAGPYQFESRDGWYSPLVASATLSTSGLSAGIHTITAQYNGDSNNAPSSSAFTVLVSSSAPPPIYDAGTINLTVSYYTATAAYDQNSTPTSIANELVSAFNGLIGYSVPVTASVNGNQITLTAMQTGVASDYPYLVQTAFDSTDFATPSFSLSSMSGNLSGGSNGTPVTSSVYSYTVPSGGYAANGNLLAYTDSVMGSWNFGYDQLNRLVSATASPATNVGANFCWAYDSFGNRTNQTTSSGSFPSAQSGSCSTTGTIYQNTVASYSNAQNQISGTNAGGSVIAPTYDAAGNTTYDGTNAYLYDGEGRVCAVMSAPYSGGTVITGYIYDAGGNRVAKGTLASFSCATTFTESTGYVVAGGVQLTEFTLSGSSPVWKHINVYAGGKLVATYDGNGLHYHIDDPLGTRRAQVNASGVLEASYQSLPFGDDLTPANSSIDPTEHHFTGKERDTESGLDYFGARYYASNMGRFMSPDDFTSDTHLKNPQSWNLYAYTRNNPLKFIDPTGEAIALTGSDDDRKAELEALKNGVGAKAGAYLYDNAITDKNGVTSHYVGVYGGGPDGKGPSFDSINGASKALSGIINDKDVATLGIVATGTTGGDKGHQVVFGPSPELTPGATETSSRMISLFLDASKSSLGHVAADQMSDGRPGEITSGDLAFHELGHQMWAIKHPALNWLGLTDHGKNALELENTVRGVQNPGGPTRKIE